MTADGTVAKCFRIEAGSYRSGQDPSGRYWLHRLDGSIHPAADPAPPAGSEDAAAWRARAEDLAAWTEGRLVNRRDAWGGYRPAEEWGRTFTRRDGTTGELGRTTTRKGRLTRADLVRHFRGGCRADLVGLHSTAPDNTSRWGAVDVDWHGPTSTAPAVNLAAALAWYAELVRRGFRPLLVDSNGAGGFHLWFVLSAPIPTARVFNFLKRLVADHRSHGMTAAPETFPKQAALTPQKDGSPGFGNWLRLIGQHHGRKHWARVWDGDRGRWLDGAAAIAHVLGLPGDPPSLVPDVPPSAATLPRRPVVVREGDNLSARVAAYLRRLPCGLGEGQGRDNIAFSFAAWMANDLRLADDVCLAWLERWDQGNSTRKGKEALEEILANAKRYGRNAGAVRPAAAPRRDQHGHIIVTHRVEVG